MNIEIRTCIECESDYEAFIHDDGIVSGGGRCPDCQKKYLEEREVNNKRAERLSNDPARNDSAWTEPRTCKKCGKFYEARYFNLLGKKFSNPRGLCPECDHIYLEAERAKEKAEEERKASLKREEWREKCGIPALYRNNRFYTWEYGRPGNVDAIQELCWTYAQNYNLKNPKENKSLILTSPRIWGLGKTNLVCCIAHWLLNRWDGQNYETASCPVKMITEGELFDSLRASYNRSNRDDHEVISEDRILKRVISARLLILDDVGKEQVADPRFVQRTLFKIINGRYNLSLPIVMTANKSADELKAYFGGVDGDEAILDRLIEMCGGKFHEVTGDSYRRR